MHAISMEIHLEVLLPLLQRGLLRLRQELSLEDGQVDHAGKVCSDDICHVSWRETAR